MIGVNDNRKNTEAFHQVAKDITRYIHFGGYDVISEIVDSSYIPVEKIKKFFNFIKIFNFFHSLIIPILFKDIQT